MSTPELPTATGCPAAVCRRASRCEPSRRWTPGRQRSKHQCLAGPGIQHLIVPEIPVCRQCRSCQVTGAGLARATVPPAAPDTTANCPGPERLSSVIVMRWDRPSHVAGGRANRDEGAKGHASPVVWIAGLDVPPVKLKATGRCSPRRPIGSRCQSKPSGAIHPPGYSAGVFHCLCTIHLTLNVALPPSEMETHRLVRRFA